MWFLFGWIFGWIEWKKEQKIKGVVVVAITKKKLFRFILLQWTNELRKENSFHMCGMWNWNEILLDLFSDYKMVSSFFRNSLREKCA